MTKTQLSEKVAIKANLRKKQAAAAVEAVLEAVKEALAKGEKVQLIPFGSFAVRSRAAREGRNPRTGRRSRSRPARPLVSGRARP